MTSVASSPAQVWLDLVLQTVDVNPKGKLLYHMSQVVAHECASMGQDAKTASTGTSAVVHLEVGHDWFNCAIGHTFRLTLQDQWKPVATTTTESAATVATATTAATIASAPLPPSAYPYVARGHVMQVAPYKEAPSSSSVATTTASQTTPRKVEIVLSFGGTLWNVVLPESRCPKALQTAFDCAVVLVSLTPPTITSQPSPPAAAAAGHLSTLVSG